MMPSIFQRVALGELVLPVPDLNNCIIEGDPESGYLCVYCNWVCAGVKLRSNTHLREAGDLGSSSNPLIYLCSYSFDLNASAEFKKLGVGMLMRNGFDSCHIQIPCQKKTIIFSLNAHGGIVMSERQMVCPAPRNILAEV